MEKEKKLIDIIVNRLNPRYRKEIIDIPNSVIPRELFEKDELKSRFSFDNLRGLGLDKTDFPTCDVGQIKIINESKLVELPEVLLDNIDCIEKLDKTTVVCGDNNKIILFDISDKYNIKQLSCYYLYDWVITLIVIDNNTLLGNTYNGEIFLLDISNLFDIKKIKSIKLELEIKTMSVLNNNIIVCGGVGSNLTFLDMSLDSLINEKIFDVPHDEIEKVINIDKNTIAYAEGNHVVIINTKDINNINMISSFNFETLILDLIQIDANILVCAGDSNKVTIIDISNINKVKEISTFYVSKNSNLNDPGCIEIDSIAKVDNNFIIVGSYDAQISLLDISNKANIKETAKYNFINSEHNRIKVCKIDRNTVVCAGEDKEVTLLDITNRQEIKILSNSMFPYNQYSNIDLKNFRLKENIIACSGYDDKNLILLDVADKQNIKEIGSFSGNGLVSSIATIDKNIIACCWKNNKKLFLLDISDIQNIKELGSFEDYYSVNNITTIDKNTIAYSGHNNKKLIILDVRDKQNIKELGSIAIKGLKNIVKIDDTTIVCSENYKLDIEDKQNIKEIGTSAIKGLKRILKTDDSKILLNENYKNKLTLLDITDKKNIKKLGSYSNNVPNKIIVNVDKNTIACGNYYSDNITLLDITNRKSIKTIGIFSISGSMYGDNGRSSIINLDKNTLIFGDWNKKIIVLDISNRGTIKKLGSYNTNVLVNSIIKLDANTIAVGGGDKRTIILDISNKENIKAIASYIPLEDDIYEVVNEFEWKWVNKNGWSFGNDEQLYKYARLYDPNSKELVPYYLLSDRVKLSDDKRELVIKKRFKRLNNINFAKD